MVGSCIDEPLELKRGTTTTSYYTADGLGSIAHLTTASGTMAESYTYDPFGTPTIKNASGIVIPSSALGNPFLFTAREWDSETALYFYRARYYKPAIGRFLSRDPLGSLPDANLYRYVNNSPQTWVDPAGTNLVVNGPGPVAIIDIWPHQKPGIIADPTPNVPGSTILDGPQAGGGIDVGPIIDIWPGDGPTSIGQIAHPFELPKPIQIIIIVGGIVLGPVVGPIEGVPGTGGPLAPKPRPPITIPVPPQEEGKGRGDGGKKGDDEENGQSKSTGPTQKKGTVLF